MVLVLGLLGLAGCGSRTYPVRGRVVFENDQPAVGLAGGFVTFQSVDENVSAQGPIQADATFVLTTFKKGDGALPGPHRVIVTPPPYVGSETGAIRPPLLNPRYSNPSSSGLEVTVEPKSNDVTLRLKRDRP
jgi:hypothetical protein